MQRHLRAGRSAAEAAELVAAQRVTVAPGEAGELDATAAAAARDELARALDGFDETAALRALEVLYAAGTPLAVVRDALLPCLRDVGDRWAAGRASVAQEHFASTFVHARLMALARGWDRGTGPRAVLACAPGEQHCLGLIAFGIALHDAGWRVVFLGADCPLPVAAEAARLTRAQLVVVAATLAQHLAGRTAELARLAGGVPTAVGGAGTSAALAEHCGASWLDGDPIAAAAAVAAG